MDDNSSIVDSVNARRPPKTIMYSDVVPLGLKARSIKYKTFPTTSQPYNAGNNTIRFNLSSSSAFLDPQLTFLKFTYTNTTLNAVATQFDGSAHTVIKRLKITSKSGGEDIENINEYGNLYNMLADLQLGWNYRATTGNMVEGFGNGSNFAPASQPAVALQAGLTNAQLTTAVGLNNAVACISAQVLSNAVGTNPISIGINEPTLASGASATFCLPLMSSVIGQLNNKYLPLFLTGDIQLEIELHARPSFTTIGDVAEPVKYSITGVELHTQLIEFESAVGNTLRAISAVKGLFIHATSWKHYPSNLSANGGSNNLLINDRLRSVKSLLMSFRPSITTNATRPVSCRSSIGMTGYQVKVGSQLYPPQVISGDASSASKNASEFFSETLKAVGCLGNSHNAGVIENGSYCITPTSAVANTYPCTNHFGETGIPARAVFGLDFDSFTKQQIESGVNTINDNPINVMLTHAQPQFATTADIYLLHDEILIIDQQGSFRLSK
jgi:hypothetical protein